MATFLLTWNPKRWKSPPPKEGRWSCGRNRRIRKGDRIFCLRQGVEPRGVIASGVVTEDAYPDEHWDKEHKRAKVPAIYVGYRLDRMIPEGDEPLATKRLAAEIPWGGWRTQSSGIAVPAGHAAVLERMWREWPGDGGQSVSGVRWTQGGATGPRPGQATGVSVVSVEALHSERFAVSPASAATVAERREQKKVRAYLQHLEGLGHSVSRHRYRIDSGADLICDLFDDTEGVLIEAKADTSRQSIRMAVGQLLDYARLEPVARKLAALLPERPSDDALEFLQSVGIDVIFRDAAGGWKVKYSERHGATRRTGQNGAR